MRRPKLRGNPVPPRPRLSGYDVALSPAERTRVMADVTRVLRAHQPIGRQALRRHLVCGLTDRQLIALMAAMQQKKLVRWIGSKDKAQWVLYGWRASKATAAQRIFNGDRPQSDAPPKAAKAVTPASEPSRSWWIAADAQASRDVFSSLLRQEHPRMAQSTFGKKLS